MELGTVISAGETPNTQNFYFVATRERAVKKGLFVEANTREGLLIGRIEEVTKTNRYFMQPEAISSYEEAINLHFPTNKWEFILCKVFCLGILGENIKKSNYPVSPGETVKIANKENLKKLFKFDNNGLKLGTLIGHDLEVKLNLNKLFQKHLAILALSGAGKSFAACVLIEELLKRREEDGKVGILVIDPHGEYKSFAYDEKFYQNVNLIKGKDIRIGVTNLSSHYYKLFLPNLSFAQERDLNKIIEELKREEDVFSIKEIIKKIENSENIKQATKDVLLSNLYSLDSTRLFGYYDSPNLNNLISPGKLSILDISEITSRKGKQMIVSYFLRELFQKRVKRKITPFIAFIEEAHNFAPEKSSKENFSKGIIEKIAREGRKFNALLCLISQRPVHLSTTSLSQCNTHMYLRITNPYDLDHIGRSCEGFTRDLQRALTTLDVGEAVIVGEASPFPLFVKIRKKDVKDVETGKSLEEECKEFLKIEENRQRNARDLMS
jgi:hypothetical protein